MPNNKPLLPNAVTMQKIGESVQPFGGIWETDVALYMLDP